MTCKHCGREIKKSPEGYVYYEYLHIKPIDNVYGSCSRQALTKAEPSTKQDTLNFIKKHK